MSAPSVVRHRRSAAHIRDLLYELVVRDMKVRYKRSVLGILWTLLNPLCLLLILDFVFRVVLNVGVPKFSAFLFTGIVVYLWFSGALTQAAGAIVENRELIRRPGFPAAILPVVTVSTHLIHFLLTLPVVFLVLVVNEIPFTPLLLLLPLIIVLQFVLTLSFALLVAAIQVTFRDAQYLLGIALMFGFYLSPIFYEASIVPERYQTVYRLNPMVHLIEAYRALLMQGTLPDARSLAVLGASSLLVFLLGYTVFVKSSHRFAEEI